MPGEKKSPCSAHTAHSTPTLHRRLTARLTAHALPTAATLHPQASAAMRSARCIDLDDGALHERLRAHELVVRGVVHHIQDARLARADLRTPGDVASVDADAAELHVAAAAAHRVDALRTDLGHGHLPTHLMLALLVMVRLLAARQPPLVLRVARDAHGACPRESAALTTRRRGDARKEKGRPPPVKWRPEIGHSAGLGRTPWRL